MRKRVITNRTFNIIPNAQIKWLDEVLNGSDFINVFLADGVFDVCFHLKGRDGTFSLYHFIEDIDTHFCLCHTSEIWKKRHFTAQEQIPSAINTSANTLPTYLESFTNVYSFNIQLHNRQIANDRSCITDPWLSFGGEKISFVDVQPFGNLRYQLAKRNMVSLPSVPIAIGPMQYLCYEISTSQNSRISFSTPAIASLKCLWIHQIVGKPIVQISPPITCFKILFSIYCIGLTQTGFIIYEG